MDKAIYKNGKTIYLRDGVEITKDEYHNKNYKNNFSEMIEEQATPGGTPTSGYPFYSYAAGVGAENISEASEICRKAGFPTEFNKDGDPLFTSQAHRKKYCKQFELYDRNAGYGDAAPTCKASTEKKKGRKTALPSSVTKQLEGKAK